MRETSASLPVRPLGRFGIVFFLTLAGLCNVAAAQCGPTPIGPSAGNPPIGLAPGVAIASTGIPVSVTTADFNGDGLLDVATADYLTSMVSVSLATGPFAWTGSSTFQAGVGFALSRATSIASGDVDGDGDVDLIVYTAGTNLGSPGAGVIVATVEFRFNDGTGAFPNVVITRPSLTPSAVVLESSLATGDINGDGALDFAVAIRGTGLLFTLNGPVLFPSFPTWTATALPADPLGGTGDPGSVGIADFTGDGIGDVVVADVPSLTANAAVRVFRGTSTGLTAAAPFLIPGNPSSFFPEISIGALFPGLGGPNDVVIFDQSTSTINIILNDGTLANGGLNGSAVIQAPLTAFGVPAARTLRTADMDGDGISDLIAATVNGLSVYWNPGTLLNFIEQAITAFPSGQFQPGRDSTTADLDGDGDLDILHVDSISNALAFQNRHGEMAFVEDLGFVCGATTLTMPALQFGTNFTLSLTGAIPNATCTLFATPAPAATYCVGGQCEFVTDVAAILLGGFPPANIGVTDALGNLTFVGPTIVQSAGLAGTQWTFEVVSNPGVGPLQWSKSNGLLNAFGF